MIWRRSMSSKSPPLFKVFYEGDTLYCDSLPFFLLKKAHDASLPVHFNPTYLIQGRYTVCLNLLRNMNASYWLRINRRYLDAPI